MKGRGGAIHPDFMGGEYLPRLEGPRPHCGRPEVAASLMIGRCRRSDALSVALATIKYR